VVVARTAPAHSLSITGSIDHRNAEAVARALVDELTAEKDALADALHPNGDLHVDVSRLEFVDVAGIRRLVRVADSAPPTSRLVLHGLPPAILRVMTVVGWADHPKLEIDEPAP
jgi:anti-anti-sigma regulatory factor